MFTVRDVITEALARANLVNRRQEAPGQMVESAFKLLKGIASDYSKHNLLQFLRREVVIPSDCIQTPQYILGNGYKEGVNFWFIDNGQTGVLPEATAERFEMGCEGWDRGGTHVYKIVQNGPFAYAWQATNYANAEEAMQHLNGAIAKVIDSSQLKTSTLIGTVDPEIDGDYVDCVCDNIANVTEAYLVTNDRMQELPLNYVSLEDFYNAGYGNLVYTWQFISDRKLEFKVKPQVLYRHQDIRLVYNVAYSIDLNSKLKIPDIYEELFTVALTYKLAVEFPRLDPTHTQRLKDTLTEIENSIKTPTRASKMIIREAGQNETLTDVSVLSSGAFIFPR